jgi:hypothetical protein
MKEKLRLLTLLGVLLVALTLTVGSVSAVAPPDATNAIIFASDTEGNPKMNFDGVETIRITWVANGLIDIEIHQGTIDGPIVTGLPDMTDLPATGHVDLTLAPGTYFIVGTGAEAVQVCSGSIFVAPESVLGALSAIGACFLAVGTITIVKRKRA